MSHSVPIFAQKYKDMEQNIRIRLLESIGKIYEESKNCKLESAFFEKVEKELSELSNYFEISHTQSLLVAMVFSLNYKGDTPLPPIYNRWLARQEQEK